jgi:PadR family transcriptional regulator PadR
MLPNEQLLFPSTARRYKCIAVADQELYSGLIRLHVLYHAAAGPRFGLGMIRELSHHGYRVGPGTLYPILHRLESKKYLRAWEQIVEGKVRKCYAITARGRSALKHATEKVRELYEEAVEGKGEPSPAHPQDGKIHRKTQRRRSARHGR